MPIDTKLEELFSLANARCFLPARRLGKRPHVSCLHRWATKGCRGVILETVMVGGTRCTSREALSRFISRLSKLQNSGPSRTSSTTSQAHIDNIEKELDAEGFD